MLVAEPADGRVAWRERRNAVGRGFTAALAFVAGLSVLVRPELALIGGVALVMMLVAASGWRRRLLIVVAGGLLPVAYQIFRMGYYALVVPGTAIAKDASGSKWPQGFVYLANFNKPYALWIPALLLIGLGLVLLATRTQPWWIRHEIPRGLRMACPDGAEPRRGGDLLRGERPAPGDLLDSSGRRLHARPGVLLAPMFCLLAPVAVIPVVLPDGTKFSREAGYLLAGATTVLWGTVIAWSLWAANSPGSVRTPPGSPIRASSTNAGSTHRPPVTRIR